jgi:hypothetical protein
VLPVAASDDWRKLDTQQSFPQTFLPAFWDSVAAAKSATHTRALRILPNKPFGKGEKFVYEIGWGPLSAGYAILSAQPDTLSGHLIVNGKGFSNSFFSSIYKVRDVIRADVDLAGIYPFCFEQHLREGGYKADRWELFDQEHNLAFTHDKNTGAVPVPAFVQDYFSMIYFVRSQHFTLADSFAFDCFVDKRSYRLALLCPQRDSITVGAGTFCCLMIKPVLVGEGRVFTKKDEILLWVTDDEYRMPVLIKAKIKFGSIIARLISYERK